MTEFSLIISGLARKKLRTALLLVSVFIAFFVFAVLAAFQHSLARGQTSGETRLIAANKISFTQSLPVSYSNRIRTLPGVKEVSHAQWFGGYVNDPRNAVVAYAVDPEPFLNINSDMLLDRDARESFLGRRDSLLVGRDLADEHGWSLGQQIPLSTTIWRRTDGSYTWPVVIRSIFEAGEDATPTNTAFMHFEYFDDARAFTQDRVGTILIETESSDLNATVVSAVDEFFANSSAEVKTVPEAAFAAAFVTQRANVGFIVVAVSVAGLVTVLLIVGNTMAGAIRERRSEIAVLKTLGFTEARIGRIVLGETLLLSIIGGMLGLGAAWLLIEAAREADPFFATLYMTGPVALAGIGMMLALGTATGAGPAIGAMRVDVITALRRA